MTGFRYERPETAFSLSTARKRPRQTSEAHLRAVRMLPCIVCLQRPIEAAHIRTGSPRNGKRETGISEKPSDQWVVPLCPEHHREQHAGNEQAFYARYRIDPFGTALALWGADGDEEAMQAIILAARKREPEAIR